jgi:uncharacterized membrane protein
MGYYFSKDAKSNGGTAVAVSRVKALVDTVDYLKKKKAAKEKKADSKQEFIELDPLKILKIRYAVGELSKKKYREMKKELEK